jgi:hypothetical protein
MPFQKGQSGNLAGKPAGLRNRATLMVEAMFDGAAKEVCQAVIDAAKKGDTAAARLVVERLCPPRRDRAVTFDLPPISKAEHLPKAAIGLLKEVASGSITPEEGSTTMRIIEGSGRAIEVADLEKRIKALEEKAK